MARIAFIDRILDNPENQLKVAVLGATGMVGQHLIQMLQNHPWFRIVILAASYNSKGKSYEEAVLAKWQLEEPIPEIYRSFQMWDVQSINQIASQVDIVFSALDLEKQAIISLEDAYAKQGVWVTSCNSAFRDDPYVPLVLPLVNLNHLDVIPYQRKKKRYTTGAIIAKSNCSIQSYVTALHPLRFWGLEEVSIFSQQSISGAGKNFTTWKDMEHNIIPFIAGEEKKSENEPLKVWGEITTSQGIQMVYIPKIHARCVRVGVLYGHLAHVTARFQSIPTQAEILEKWNHFPSLPLLPSSPKQPLYYCDAADRPQPKLDVMREKGMGITLGQLQINQPKKEVQFSALAHNVILGAAGGAIWATEAALFQELIYKKT